MRQQPRELLHELRRRAWQQHRHVILERVDLDDPRNIDLADPPVPDVLHSHLPDLPRFLRASLVLPRAAPACRAAGRQPSRPPSPRRRSYCRPRYPETPRHPPPSAPARRGRAAGHRRRWPHVRSHPARADRMMHRAGRAPHVVGSSSSLRTPGPGATSRARSGSNDGAASSRRASARPRSSGTDPVDRRAGSDRSPALRRGSGLARVTRPRLLG